MRAGPTRIGRLRWWLTFHVPGAYRLRCWLHDRRGRPGFRPSDYR